MAQSPYALAITAGLNSGNAEFRKLAIRHVNQAFVGTGGNAVRAAAMLGVSHRTLMRWVQDPEVSRLLQTARGCSVHDTNVIA